MIEELKELRARVETQAADQAAPGKRQTDHTRIDGIFRQITDNVDEVIFMFTPDWRKTVYVSSAYEKIWGQPVEEMYHDARSWTEAIVPEDRGRVDAFIDGQSRGDIAFDNRIEFSIRDTGGNLRRISGRTYPVLDGSGAISRITGIAEDITERKKAEEQLRNSEKFLINIFDCFQDGISILDKDLNIVRVNHVMEKWHPYMMPLEGKKCYHVYHERSAPCERCPSIRAIRQKTAQSDIVPFHEKDGIQRGWLELYAFPLKDDDGNVIGVIEHVRDITQRKNAEESLSLMQHMIDQAEDEASLAWPDGRFYYVNDAKCRSLGYSKEELLALHIWDVDPDMSPEIWSRAWQDLKEKRYVKRETLHRTKDGTIFPTEIWSSYIDFHGSEYVCAFVRDITERKDTEKSLKLTQFTMDRAGDMILWVAPDSRFTYVNEAACRTFGYKLEEMTAMTTFDTCPSWTKDSWAEHWREIKERGSFTIEKSMRKKDGSFFPAEISVNYLVYDGKEYNCSFIRDVTDRKRAEEALKESEEKFRVLAETTRAGILLYRGKKIVYVNPALEHITGYRKDELLGKNYWDVVDSEHKEMVRSRGLARQQWRKTPSTYEVKIRSKSGETRWVELSPALISFHGRQTGLATIFDITDRKRSEADLHDAKGQAELYLDLMGHDINNLNQIGIGFLEMALGTLKLDRESRELIARPLEAIEASSRLIANVRKLQKVKEGGLKFKEIQIADKLREIIPRYSDIPGRDIRISCDAGCECTVMANDLLDDVFANIIHNAIKHSTGPLAIDVHLSTAKVGDRKYALVAIEDDGPGIPDELKGRLFSRSGQSNAKATGRGLGLHLVRTLVEDFDGKVWVEDRVRGDQTKGSRLVIMLPAVDQEDARDTC